MRWAHVIQYKEQNNATFYREKWLCHLSVIDIYVWEIEKDSTFHNFFFILWMVVCMTFIGRWVCLLDSCHKLREYP